VNALERLLPPGVITVEATREMWESPLHPEEEVYVARAVPKRRREFAAGRACARAALACFGVAEGPLLRDADRCPVWARGFVGSISHCHGFCAASVARAEHLAGVGIDAEQSTPLPPRLHAMIATPRERERFARLPPEDGVDWPKVLFSATRSSSRPRPARSSDASSTRARRPCSAGARSADGSR
jgi:4'-phosphopantetheinyl transferase EntD